MFNKKLITVFLTVAISIMYIPFNAAAASGVKGDANGDGVLSIRDAAYIAGKLSKNIEVDISGDYNSDGKVDIRDASAIAIDLTSPYSSYVTEILRLVNAERAKVGVKPLKLDISLVNAANIRAEEISEAFSHSRPDGSLFSTVLDDLGINYYCGGENIAAGCATAQITVQQWINSPTHYENITNPRFTHLGVGYYYDENTTFQHHWAQIFKCN